MILAASSPFFENLLKRNKHPHPLIYMRGVQSLDLVAIIDFLYYGEANVYQENLDTFLAIAEELKLKGLTGQNAGDIMKEDLANAEPDKTIKDAKKPRNSFPEQYLPTDVPFDQTSTVVAIPDQFDGDLEALDAKVKSMMEKSKNMVPAGKLKQTKAFICKVCGKEGHPAAIKDHIERKHLEGIAIPCTFCDKIFSSRNSMSQHKTVFHKSIISNVLKLC